MNPPPRPRRLLGLLALFVLAPSAPALAGSTWVVDDTGGAGVDFLDIQPAVDVAVSGDLILVHPGTYGAFALGSGVTIFGTGASTPRVTGQSVVAGVPGTTRAALHRMRFDELLVADSVGPVVLDALEFTPLGGLQHALVVRDCSDVRLHQCAITPGSTDYYEDGGHGATLLRSRVEFAECTVRGENARDFDDGDNDCTSWGGDGIRATDAEVHVTASNVSGGHGMDHNGGCHVCPSSEPGEGGDGIEVDGTTTLLVLTGDSTHTVLGGDGGYVGQLICSESDGGHGVLARAGAELVRSIPGVTIAGGVDASGAPSSAVRLETGGSQTIEATGRPFLLLGSTPPPAFGGSAVFTIEGPAGTEATLFLGRRPTIIATQRDPLEILVSRQRRIPLGPMPAGGSLVKTIALPPILKQGFVFYAQAEVLLGDGTILRTNSVPIAVR